MSRVAAVLRGWAVTSRDPAQVYVLAWPGAADDPPTGAARAHTAHAAGRLASVDVYGRPVGLFEALALDAAGWWVVRGLMSQARLAERPGASRAMVSRLLQGLARAGCFKVTGGHIALLKKLPLRW